MTGLTHNARVLQLLSDRRPHSHHELYALHVIAHSRVADLRAMGHDIEAWRDGEDYFYQLVRDRDLGTVPAGSVAEGDSEAHLATSSQGPSPGIRGGSTGPGASTTSLPRGAPAQLTVWENAA